MSAPTLASPFLAPDAAAELLAAVPEPEPVESLAPDTAPAKPRKSRSGTSRADRKAKSPDAAPRAPRAPAGQAAADRRVHDSVLGLHQLGGAVIGSPMLSMPITGQALAASAPDAAEVWVKLARRYPAVARMFDTGGDGVVFVQLAMVYAPLVMLALSERQAAAGGAPLPDFGAMLGDVTAPPTS